MDWKILKPTKSKIFILIVIILIWYFSLYVYYHQFLNLPSVDCTCVLGGFDNCIDYPNLIPIPGDYDCHCGCGTLSTFLKSMIVLILPGIIVYIAYSFFKNYKVS